MRWRSEFDLSGLVVPCTLACCYSWLVKLLDCHSSASTIAGETFTSQHDRWLPKARVSRRKVMGSNPFHYIRLRSLSVKHKHFPPCQSLFGLFTSDEESSAKAVAPRKKPRLRPELWPRIQRRLHRVEGPAVGLQCVRRMERRRPLGRCCWPRQGSKFFMLLLKPCILSLICLKLHG